MKDGTDIITDKDEDTFNAFINYFTRVFTKFNDYSENNIPYNPCNSVVLNFNIKRINNNN